MQKNVLGEPLYECSCAPMTGFYRTGKCETGSEDLGNHTVCTKVSTALEFSKAKGNDLSTPRPEFGFAGLKDGDLWCLCASRWQEAFDAGVAPSVRLMATHERALELIELKDLKANAVDLS